MRAGFRRADPTLPLVKLSGVVWFVLARAAPVVAVAGGCAPESTPPPVAALPVPTAPPPPPAPAPPPPPDYDTAAWTEVGALDSTIALDLRYATADNFVGEAMYDCGRCFLRPAAARSLVAIHDSLRALGLGLRLFDCYRPLPVQWRLWRRVPDPRYVADPRKGSQHNRGVAVDLTLASLATGEPLDMGTAYDYFGGEAWHRATAGFPEPVRGNRERLVALMEGMGWRRTNSEWWHYSYPLDRAAAPLDSMEWACRAR